jgi:periplasmic divalent cation tolerance protein
MQGPYPAGRRFHAPDGGGKIRRVDQECCEIVITADDGDWLAGFTRALIEERLAACGHLTTPIRSVYRWNGAVHDESESRVALHTRRSLVAAIVARTGEAHSYDVPCVIALPVVEGNPDYLRWIVAETRDPV